MAPVKFDDLGKAASDLINKNYHFGFVNLDAKTTSANGMTFTTKGVHNTNTGAVNGGIETEMSLANGVTFTESLGTDNVINSTLSLDDKLANGLKVDIESSFVPDSGKMNAALKAAYTANDMVNATVDIDCSTKPTIQLSSVFGGIPSLKGFSVGCQASYDTANLSLVSPNIGFSYQDGDFLLHAGVNDSSKYVGSVHHQISEKLSAGALVNYTSGSSSSTITLGGKYIMDANSFVKAKINNDLHLGVSYVQNLRDGVQLTMSGLVNTKGLNEGGHKIGLNLKIDA